MWYNGNETAAHRKHLLLCACVSVSKFFPERASIIYQLCIPVCHCRSLVSQSQQKYIPQQVTVVLKCDIGNKEELVFYKTRAGMISCVSLWCRVEAGVL